MFRNYLSCLENSYAPISVAKSCAKRYYFCKSSYKALLISQPTNFPLNPKTVNVTKTVHWILVNNHLDAQFFMYAYFYPLHVSGSHVPIIRRIVASMRHLVYVVCRLHTRPSSTQSDINQVSHWYNNSPDDGHMAARNM